MGKKNAICTLALILLLTPMVVEGHTCADVHVIYDLDMPRESYTDQLSIVGKYNDLHRFISMYNYIDLSVPDTETQDARMVSTQERVADIEAQLLNGYNLQFSEILELEEELENCQKYIVYLEGTYEYSNVEIDIPDVESLPTREEYANAKEVLANRLTDLDIGDLSDLKYPVVGEATIPLHSENDCYFDFNGIKPIITLTNGTVSAVTEDSVSIEAGDIYITYSMLKSIDVVTGDTVKQYERIGYGTDGISVAISVGEIECDLYELYKEVIS